MKIVVIIPTYNEAENINRLLGVVLEEFKQISGHEMEVLVVDGFSPDGTAEIVKSLSKENPCIHLVEKEKSGLGADYIFGMRFAMEKMEAEAVIEMDADFQHDPRDIKRFVAQLDAGYDYVIGSRYIEGGSIPGDWAFHRRFISILGNLVARLVLWLPDISDYTTGFKASRVHGFLDKIDLSRILSKGFAYKMHLLSEMVDRRAKVKEIPISFATRGKGISKMEGNNLGDSLLVVLKIRIRKSNRFLKFLVVGFVGLIADFLSYFVMVRFFDILPSLASAISAQPAVISNFVLNNLWTFADRKHTESKKFAVGLLISILASNIGVLFIRAGVIFLSSLVFGRKSIINYVIGTALLVVYNFTVYNRYIWPRVKKSTGDG